MEYMGTKEASEKWQVNQNTISRWCREGRIPEAEQDAERSPWRIPISFTPDRLLPSKAKKERT